MLTTFLATLEKMLRILLLLAIGFAFNKLHFVPRAAEGVLSRFVTLLFLPCLLFYSNVMECRVDSLAANLGLVLLGAVLCLISMGLSHIVGKPLGGRDTYQQGVFRYALTFPNTGAVATPLVLAFFGTEGLFVFNLFYYIPGWLIYTWGIVQLQASHGERSFWDLMKKCFTPATVVPVIGMVIGILGGSQWMPSVILNVTSSLGDCYVTVGLLLTGFTIADYPFNKVFGNLRVWIFTVLRLIVIPAVFSAAVILCGAPLMTCIMVVLAYAGPCGMNPVIYAAAYGEDCEMGASMVLLSSLCSVVTIPVMYTLVQHFAA